jgi:hypothetical protein
MMGYQAQLVSVVDEYGSDACMILTFERLAAVLDVLKEEEFPYTHLSWCKPIANVASACADSPVPIAATVAELFRQYGFDAFPSSSSGDVCIGWWGGDKIGMSFDAFMRALAVGVDPDCQFDLLWLGEDSDPWAIRLHGGHFFTRQVKWTIV